MSNTRRLKPDEPVPGLNLNAAEAQALMDEANDWQSYRYAIKPGPVRFRVGTAPVQIKTPDGPLTQISVVLTAGTSNGVQVLHLPPNLAVELADLLMRNAAEARGGIVVPGH